MDSIYEIRRANLRDLIQRRHQGSSGSFAKMMAFENPSFASRLISQNPSNQKNIGAQLARRIEEVHGLQRNSLDKPPDPGDVVVAGMTVKTGEAQLLAFYRSLSPLSQAQLLVYASQLHTEEHPDRPMQPKKERV